jgi:hypothetical protein
VNTNNIVETPTIDGALIGGIVGGVAGGLLILGAIIGLACFFMRKPSSDNDGGMSGDVPLSRPSSEYGTVSVMPSPYSAPPVTSTTNIYGPAPPVM